MLLWAIEQSNMLPDNIYTNGGLAVFCVSVVFWLIRKHDRQIRQLTTESRKAIETLSRDNKELLSVAQADNKDNRDKTFEIATKTIECLEHVTVKLTEIRKAQELLPEMHSVLKELRTLLVKGQQK